MTKDEAQKLFDDLAKELQNIDSQLKEIASENPVVKGDFDVRVEDLGDSLEDSAQEMASLDQRQALVDSFERRRKEVVHAMEKIKAGTYGKCEKCSADIQKERLTAMPVAALCITCAKTARKI